MTWVGTKMTGSTTLTIWCIVSPIEARTNNNEPEESGFGSCIQLALVIRLSLCNVCKCAT